MLTCLHVLITGPSWLATKMVFLMHSAHNALVRLCIRGIPLHWNASEHDKSRSDAQRKYTHMCETAQHMRTATHTEAGMLSGTPNSTRYVRVPAGSRNSAIHTAYHTLLRLSSLVEPGHPLLKLASTTGGTSPQNPLPEKHSTPVETRAQRFPEWMCWITLVRCM